jgi:stearoyl-CoA desaturase (Delta-9 desaturase)
MPQQHSPNVPSSPNLRESWYRRLNWTNTIFLIVSPLLVITLLPVTVYFNGLDWRMVVLFVVACLCTSISITGGYHRLFAHKSYQAHVLLKLFYLICGAAALQGSALKWCSDHRRHHRNVDTDKDPYSIKKGFFFAHIGWVFLKEEEEYKNSYANDLASDPLVKWQDKYCVAIAIIVGFVVPTLVGWAFDRPLSGLLWGGFARVVVTHHCTFFINSLCHMWGSQPFNLTVSARDNFVLAFFTYGEGYHNFHHKFEGDYRNGFRWYHWDPTKWTIKTLSYLKMTWNLRKISETEILRAKLAVQEQNLRVRGYYDEQMSSLRLKIEEAHRNVQHLKASYAQFKLEYPSRWNANLQRAAQSRAEFLAKRNAMVAKLKADINNAKYDFRFAMAQWRRAYSLAG